MIQQDAPVSTNEWAGRRAIVVCDQWLGSNGYAGMKALRRAGWSVLVMPEWEFVPVRWRTATMRIAGRALRQAAVREFNAALRAAVSRTRPELLLVFKGTFVEGATLRESRELGVRSYCFFPDVSTRTHGPYLPDALPEYDLVFSTKRFGARDLGAIGVRQSAFVHHAFDPDLHRPVEVTDEDRTRYACAASFIGTWSPKKERYLVALQRAVPEIDLRIWGAQWDRITESLLRKAIAGHTVEGEEYVRAIRCSRINIGLLSERRPGASGDDQVTSRTFHIPAAGGFMLHERTEELDGLLREDIEVACFDGVEEFGASVRRWLDDESGRARIAAAGASTIRRSHSWDQRIREILSYHQASTQ